MQKLFFSTISPSRYPIVWNRSCLFCHSRSKSDVLSKSYQNHPIKIHLQPECQPHWNRSQLKNGLSVNWIAANLLNRALEPIYYPFSLINLPIGPSVLLQFPRFQLNYRVNRTSLTWTRLTLLWTYRSEFFAFWLPAVAIERRRSGHGCMPCMGKRKAWGRLVRGRNLHEECHARGVAAWNVVGHAWV